jgi:hypothetical protein
MAEDSQDAGGDRAPTVQGMWVIESRRGEHCEQNPATVRAGKTFPHARTARREIGELSAAGGRQSAPGYPGRCYVGWNANLVEGAHGAFPLICGALPSGNPRAAQVPDRGADCREQLGDVSAEVANCLR